ncbi:MAG TPA: alternative ribosome rescue aminoacyl-tRNA hydrolase ArfB [Chitinophagaceae bacterium]|nr:alternative ribosome rescue aminoacyl-tRNA hydrolase ArfB [Chitinophagaceae bacterium]
MIDVFNEIRFQTSRSGGKGGQNVNKVETSVEGYFHIDESRILNDDQKALVQEKLANRINSEGFLQVRSQIHRTQLANKEEVVEKMNNLITNSLKKQKKRIATKPSKFAKQKRAESKIGHAEKKQGRQKFKF